MKRTNIVIAGVSVLAIVVVLAMGINYIRSFFSAFAPPKIEMTREYISTNRTFNNGVTIESITVDSIGANRYPVSYTVTQMTSCNLTAVVDKITVSPSKIYFKVPGDYSWYTENVRIPMIHEGLGRRTSDSTDRLPFAHGKNSSKVCPLQFESDHWYFIQIGDPKLTGIFLYVTKDWYSQLYYLESGVSPI